MPHFDQAFIEMVRSHPESEAMVTEALPDPIAKIENEIGYEFPPSYKEFLGHINGGVIGSIRLFGVARGDHLDFTTKLVEHSDIPSIEARIMIPFASDWGGSLFCFDTYHPTGGGEYAIWYWDHEYSEEPADAPYVWTQIESSFERFMLNQFPADNGG